MSEHLHPLASKSKPSKVEEAKVNGRHLRGTIADVLNSDAPTFDHDDMQLLKFHGIYQQDDRDARDANKAIGLDREYMLMIRVKVPGGALTPEQYLAMDKIGNDHTWTHSLRLTTRQNFQLHGVLKGDAKPALKKAYQVLLDSINGCGDVARNVMAPPTPFKTPAHQAVLAAARSVSAALTPESHAYFEIWLDEEKVDSSQEQEPLYGETMLPRKFKTAFALPEDNSVDVHSQDLGYVAHIVDGKVVGANVLVGGGLGMTHRQDETYARLASDLGYVKAEHFVETAQLVAAMFRDYGDRTDRRHARLKYVIEEQGIESFRKEFNARASFALEPSRNLGKLEYKDWLGRHEQGDGRHFIGVFVQNGRIVDTHILRLKTVLRKIVEAIRPTVVLTPNQNIIFADLTADDADKVERMLKAYNVPMPENMTWIKRGSMACPAQPTCGLALTESERVFPDVVHEIEEEFKKVGLANEPITIRMTGCPNGCARPYTADIGLVGHKPGHYDMFIGGSINGNRFADFYSENVPMEELGSVLRPIIESWAKNREGDEPFSDYYQRTFGKNPSKHVLTGSRDNGMRDEVEQKLLSLPVL